jgi:hypothetical protein
MIVIVEASAPPPQLDGRHLLGDLYRQLAPNLLGLAQVVRGHGFTMSAARALMSAVLAPYPFPSRIFSETDSAVPWLANHVAQRHHAITRADLQNLIVSGYAKYTWKLPTEERPRIAV